MEATELLLFNLVLTLGLMTGLWLISIPIRNVSIVDIYWGPGFGVIAISTLVQAEGYEPRMWLLTSLTVLWALRLGLHLWIRNVGHGEDSRYAGFRAEVTAAGGNYMWRSWLTVFVLQGVLMWIVSLPVQLGQLSGDPASLGLLAWLGSALWFVGFVFEAVGDYQLMRFKKDPENRGKILGTGLWRYTRHPNYFGNACLWWGLYLIAAEVSLAAWCIFSPILMTFFLLKVSGVAMLEQSIVDRRPGYAEYIRKTSAFLPRPPRD